MINRYSSRTIRLGKQFFNDKLHNARSYDRIAGYFSSSVFEITGEAIEGMSGKVRLPDVLEDVWVYVAMGKKADAERIIDNVPMQHPFEIKYEKQVVNSINWENCRIVLSESEKRKCLLDGWG
ncbi:MAG: hypothetical protein QME49_00405 [bacterium]|nr:hypothetical protein [bacterium]